MTFLPFQIDLKDKVAVVTGGAGILCGQFVDALAACGAKVAILDRDLANAEAKAASVTEKGGIAIGVAADVLSKESLKAAHEVVLEKFGPCDILINGAGGNHPLGTTTKEYLYAEDVKEKLEDTITFFDLDPQGVQFVFNLNFLGTLLPSQEFASDMINRKGATIINVSSISQFEAATGRCHYCASKGAIGMLTKGMALELAEKNITVNAVLPGSIHTDFNDDVLSDPEFYAKCVAGIPAGRLGKADDIAGAVVMLASDEASYISGAEIVIDGAKTVF